MHNTIPRMFINGLLAILPISLTCYAIYWIATTAERILGGPLRSNLGVYPTGYYFYGLGMAIGIVAVFILGMFLEFYLGRMMLRWSEALMGRIPIVKTIYSSIKDLLDFIANNSKPDKGSNMVVIEPFPGTRMLGYVTRDKWDNLKCDDLAREGEVAVFIPFSYALGGYTVMVAREKVQPVGMTFEEGYRFALTAYMISPSSTRKPQKKYRRTIFLRREEVIETHQPDSPDGKPGS